MSQPTDRPDSPEGPEGDEDVRSFRRADDPLPTGDAWLASSPRDAPTLGTPPGPGEEEAPDRGSDDRWDPATHEAWWAPDAGAGADGGGDTGWPPSGPSGGWSDGSGPWVPSDRDWTTQLWTIPPRRRRARRVVAFTMALAIAVAGVLGGVIAHLAWTPSSPTSSAGLPLNGGGRFSGPPFGGSPQGQSPSGSSTPDGPTNAAAIAARVSSGLVDVDTTLTYQDLQGAGTGMVLDASGEVLTNNHVIEGATRISVTDIGNGRTYAASVVGYDRSDDVAVIQLSDASGLQTVDLGDSSKLSVGNQVVGIGNAEGAGGTPSYAGGAVTALDQSVSAADEADGATEQLSGLIETDADIISGDSGGPLVDTSGRVVGVDTAGSDSFEFQASGDQGFAIPIDHALQIAEQIESGSTTSDVHLGATAFLGVEVQSAGTGSSSGGGGAATPAGAAIASVVPGGPAAQGGLEQGDTITSLGGASITSAQELTTQLLGDRPGESVQVGYVGPSGEPGTADVQLGSGPPQ